MMPSEAGTPPVMVQSTPVPAHVMHSRTLRRFMPSSCSAIARLLLNVLLEARLARAEIYSRMIVITKKSDALRNLFACRSVSQASSHHGCVIQRRHDNEKLSHHSRCAWCRDRPGLRPIVLHLRRDRQ